MFALALDVRHAIRSLGSRPGFLVAAVLTLAIGIGANLTVFSLVNALLLRPLPFGDRSDRVVVLFATHQLQAEDWGWGESELSYRDLQDYREATSLAGLAGYLPRNFTLSDAEPAERVQGGSVTPDLFGLLGVEPALGRGFRPDDAAPPGLESVVMITDGLWRRRYGADPAIVGRPILVNDLPRTVIGVLPPGFRFPERDDLYMPLRWDDAPRAARNVNGVGLLTPGVTLPQAQGELDAIAARLSATYPESNRGFGVRALTFRDAQVNAAQRGFSATLMGAVAFVLFIACANLANLLLVRGASRQREFAVRAAMGAGRGRLVRGMLVESFVLTVPGAGLGLLGALWTLDLVRGSFPEDLPYWIRFDIDGRVLAFTAGLSVVTAVAIGLVPALRASRPDLQADLKEAGRGASLGRGQQRLQFALSIGQVALCLALLVGANLMVRSFLALQSADLGFDDRPMLTMRGYLAGDQFDPVAARSAFFSRAASTLRSLPGVTAAAVTTAIPGDDGGGGVRVVIDGRAQVSDEVGASAIASTEGLFDTLGVSLLDGRPFTPAEVDNPDARVAIVNRALATRLWPGGRAVDRRVGFAGADGIDWYRVIGVAPDVQYEEVGEDTDQSRLNVYVPYAANPSRSVAFLLRTAVPPGALAASARSALQSLNAGLPLYDVLTMPERRRATTWEQQFFGQMVAVFAGVALLLACLGIYALLSYAARRRQAEIGVRLALGAGPGDIVRLFLRQGGLVAAAGLGLGLGLAFVVSRVLMGVLFGVDAFDPWLYAGTGGALLTAVLAASYLPARRAGRVDPVIALREE
ncbi:MAG: ABC transporter permease [Vicinamibacterales bacterium]